MNPHILDIEKIMILLKNNDKKTHTYTQQEKHTNQEVQYHHQFFTKG